MQFINGQAIYLQIADHVCEKILLKEWAAEERVLSVRELAVNLEVNPNTVMRAYEFLQQQGLISNQRGVGYFVATDAVKKAQDIRKKEFYERDLPVVFRNMVLLEIGTEELGTQYDEFIKGNTFTS